MPILEDLYNALRQQGGKGSAKAGHGAGNLCVRLPQRFNHHTNVDVNNRLVCYDIKELGKQLKKLGMLIVQDQVWGRVTANRAEGKSTRYYVDEFHMLLKEEQTAAYSVEIWKRFRKWGGIQPESRRTSKTCWLPRNREHFREQRLHLHAPTRLPETVRFWLKSWASPHQLSYVTQSGEGEGLLFYGSVILPFQDRFPRTPSSIAS